MTFETFGSHAYFKEDFIRVILRGTLGLKTQNSLLDSLTVLILVWLNFRFGLCMLLTKNISLTFFSELKTSYEIENMPRTSILTLVSMCYMINYTSDVSHLYCNA